MGVKNDNIENYALMFPFLLGAVLKHARNLLESAYNEEDVDLPKEEDENPKTEEQDDKEAKEFLDNVTNGVNYFYADDADDWNHLNDGSEVDKKMKAVLDDFIFRIKIHQPDFDYKIAFNFKKKDGNTLKFRFFWNHDFDCFEGTCDEIEDVFYYNELEKYFETDARFINCGDECPVCDCEEVCEEAEEEAPKKEYVAPNCEVVNKPMGAQVTVQEFEGDVPEKEDETTYPAENTAKYLYEKLNTERKDRKEKYVEELEIAVKHVIDYSMFEPVTDNNGTVYRISFSADDFEANIPHREFNNFLSVLTQKEVNDIIKNRFGFVRVQYVENEDRYYADLI